MPRGPIAKAQLEKDILEFLGRCRIPPSQKELAARFGYSQQWVSEVIRGLERDGKLVRNQGQHRDMRVVK